MFCFWFLVFPSSPHLSMAPGKTVSGTRPRPLKFVTTVRQRLEPEENSLINSYQRLSKSNIQKQSMKELPKQATVSTKDRVLVSLVNSGVQDIRIPQVMAMEPEVIPASQDSSVSTSRWLSEDEFTYLNDQEHAMASVDSKLEVLHSPKMSNSEKAQAKVHAFLARVSSLTWCGIDESLT